MKMCFGSKEQKPYKASTPNVCKDGKPSTRPVSEDEYLKSITVGTTSSGLPIRKGKVNGNRENMIGVAEPEDMFREGSNGIVGGPMGWGT